MGKFMKKIGVIILTVILFLFVQINFVSCSASECSKVTEMKLKQYLYNNKINGIIIENQNGSKKIIANKIAVSENYNVQADKYFPIASLQKVLTGVAIYNLIKENKISLNEPVVNVLKQFKGNDNVTIKQLMMHSSGIVDLGNVPSQALMSENKRAAYSLNDYKTTNNYNWLYASSNFELLANIIRKKSNGSYYLFLNSEIFKKYRLNEIKYFNQLDYEEVTLPLLNGAGKKETLLEICTLASIDRNLKDKIRWYFLEKDLSNCFGAGDILSTPRCYWNFVNKYLLKQSILLKEWRKYAESSSHNYFGGIYFDNDYIYASGNMATYNCCFFCSNIKSGKTIMLFANNINYKKLKRIENNICHIYFRS